MHIAVLGTGAWLGLRGNDQATAQYTYATVTRADVSQVVTGSGTVKPSSTLAQRVFRQGSVTGLGAVEGAAVKPGAELFRIDNKPEYALEGPAPFYRMLTSTDDEGDDVTGLQTLLKPLGSGIRPPLVRVRPTWTPESTSHALLGLRSDARHRLGDQRRLRKEQRRGRAQLDTSLAPYLHYLHLGHIL